MIDIKKLEAYLEENYDESDSSDERGQNLFFKNNLLVDFARS